MSKIIVITGAGVGLGRAVAQRLAVDGDTPVLLGRNVARVEQVAADIGGRALGIGCDVSSPDAVRAAFVRIAERFGRIDVLVNNAAVFEPFLIAEATDAQIVQGLSTNLIGPIICARAAIPLMPRGSLIVNVSSESVDLPFPHLLVYQAGKAGLERFSTGLHRELEASGIRVTIVRAGAMMEEGKVWEADPAAQMRFAQAAMASGLNLRERPISQFASVAETFRMLIDLPADLHAASIALHAR